MTEPLKPSTILDRAADLITPEGAWWNGKTEGAAGACIIEALSKCYPASNAPPWQDTRSWITVATGVDDIAWWNDGHTQSENVAALRKAAELAREDGQ